MGTTASQPKDYDNVLQYTDRFMEAAEYFKNQEDYAKKHAKYIKAKLIQLKALYNTDPSPTLLSRIDAFAEFNVNLTKGKRHTNPKYTEHKFIVALRELFNTTLGYVPAIDVSDCTSKSKKYFATIIDCAMKMSHSTISDVDVVIGGYNPRRSPTKKILYEYTALKDEWFVRHEYFWYSTQLTYLLGADYN